MTPHNIQAKTEAMLAFQKAKPRSPHMVPDKSALLVLDMQKYFLEPESHAYIPSAHAILPNMKNLIAAFTKNHWPVIFTRHVNTPQDAGTMARWWHDLIRLDNPISEITPKLDTRNHTVLQKSQYDAFYQTDLDTLLKQKDIQQVLITGVMTHLCCETTARSAFMRSFDVFFIVDGTATYNEAFHRASLLNLAHGFATLSSTNQLLEVLA